MLLRVVYDCLIDILSMLLLSSIELYICNVVRKGRYLDKDRRAFYLALPGCSKDISWAGLAMCVEALQHKYSKVRWVKGWNIVEMSLIPTLGIFYHRHVPLSFVGHNATISTGAVPFFCVFFYNLWFNRHVSWNAFSNLLSKTKPFQKARYCQATPLHPISALPSNKYDELFSISTPLLY